MSRKTKDILDVIIPLVIFWIAWWFIVFRGFSFIDKLIIVHCPQPHHSSLSLIEKWGIYVGFAMIPTSDMVLSYRKKHKVNLLDDEYDEEDDSTPCILIIIMVVLAVGIFVKEGFTKLINKIKMKG